MKNLFTLTFLLLLAGMTSAKNAYLPPVNNVDLALTITSENATPDIYSVTMAEITLTNTGGETATSITVNIPVPAGFVLTGSNEYDATAGTYSGASGNWRIENLASGTSETLTLNIFTLTENPVSLYGQVAIASGEDIDSTPGNGTPNSPNEDDEAVFYFNGAAPVELPDLVIGEVTIVLGSSTTITQGSGLGFQVELVNQGGIINPDDFPYNNGIYLSEDANFSSNDLLLEETLISGVGTLTMGGFIPTDFPVGTRYLFFATDIDSDIIESVETNNVSLAIPITVISANAGDGVDLELSLAQSTGNPDRFSRYSVVLTLENTGSETAESIQVSVPRPTGVVYSGGNPFSLTLGSFSESTDLLTVDELPAGTNTQLTLNYFLLVPEAPIVYAQVTQATGEDADSTPDNGTPPMVNEDDEASTDEGITPPLELPDLVINEFTTASTIQLQIPTILNYQVGNIGNAAAGGIFNVTYFYSTDNQLDFGDQEVGRKIFLDLEEGSVVNEMREIIITNSVGITPGPGFLILKIDNEEVMAESNENNNIIVRAVTIIPLSAAPSCATNLGSGDFDCIGSNSLGGQDVVLLNSNETSSTYQVDGDGMLVNTITTEVEEEISYNIGGTNDSGRYLLRRLEDGSFEYIDIPGSISDNYVRLMSATPFNDGFLFLAYENGDTNFPSSYSDFTAILTDENLNPVHQNILDPTSFSGFGLTNGLIQVSPDHVAFIRVVSENGLSRTSLYVVDRNLNISSTISFPLGEWNTGGNLRKLSCGKFEVNSSTATACIFPSPNNGLCDRIATSRLGAFVNGEFIIESTVKTIAPRVPDSTNPFRRVWTLATQDGGEVTAIKNESFSETGPNDDEILLFKIINGDTIWTKTVELMGSGEHLMEIGGDIYFIVTEGTFSNTITRYYEIDCLDDHTITPPSDGVDLELTAELPVVDPEIYTKYWVIYTLRNNGSERATDIAVDFVLPTGTVYVGSNPFMISRGRMSTINNEYTLDELAAGETAVIQLNYFLKSSLSQIHYAQISLTNEEDRDSSPDNGTPPVANEDDETAVATSVAATLNELTINQNEEAPNRLEILKLYPNPTMDREVTLVFSSPAETVRTLVIYNAQGTEVIRKPIMLNAGYNEIRLAVQNLPSGIYRILIPGEQTRFTTGSFTVAK